GERHITSSFPLVDTLGLQPREPLAVAALVLGPDQLLAGLAVVVHPLATGHVARGDVRLDRGGEFGQVLGRADDGGRVEQVVVHSALPSVATSAGRARRGRRGQVSRADNFARAASTSATGSMSRRPHFVRGNDSRPPSMARSTWVM